MIYGSHSEMSEKITSISLLFLRGKIDK